jgi:hypothetical protein
MHTDTQQCYSFLAIALLCLIDSLKAFIVSVALRQLIGQRVAHGIGRGFRGGRPPANILRISNLRATDMEQAMKVNLKIEDVVRQGVACLMECQVTSTWLKL